MFTRNDFDIAPDTAAASPRAWWCLGIAAAAVLAGAVALHEGLERYRGAAADASRLAAARTSHGVVPSNALPPEAARALRRVQAERAVSWNRLLSALEAAGSRTHGACQLLSVQPERGETDTARTVLTAIAGSPTVMLDYIAALGTQPGIGDVRLELHQSATVAGEQVVRFQLAFTWQAAPARPS